MGEAYQGVKFSVIFRNQIAPEHIHINKLRKWCKIFHEYDLAPPYEGGSYGNLSFRVAHNSNEFIITGTQIGLKDDLQSDSFVKVLNVNLEKKELIVEGTRKPSSETMLHDAIYKKRADVMCVFHGHSPEILENAEKMSIIQTKTAEFYGTIELVNSVLDILTDDLEFFIIRQHGFFVIGKDFDTTGNRALIELKRCIIQ